MLTIESLIGVISLCMTSFELGYTIESHKTQKPPCPKNHCASGSASARAALCQRKRKMG